MSHRWRTDSWSVVGILVALTLIGMAVSDLRYHWSAYGWYTVLFSEEQIAESQKSFWDWLELLIVPAVIALGGILIGRAERRREQREQQQVAILAALRDSQSIGAVALLLARDPQPLDESHLSTVLTTLCIGFVFESSSRARALILTALRKFSEDNKTYEEIRGIVDDVVHEFASYDAALIEGEVALEKYKERLVRLKSALR